MDIEEKTVFVYDGAAYSTRAEAEIAARRDGLQSKLFLLFRDMRVGGDLDNERYAALIGEQPLLFYAVLKSHLEPEPELQPVDLDTLCSFVQRLATKADTHFSSYTHARKFARVLANEHAGLILMLKAHELWLERQAAASAPAIALPGPVESPDEQA